MAHMLTVPQSNRCFILWGYLNCLLHATSVQDVAELEQHVESTCETVRGKAGIFCNMYDNLCQALCGDGWTAY
jgi:hypothetical protein